MRTSRILPRAVALGLAAGARSSLGPGAPLWAAGRGNTPRRCLVALAVAGEITMDKTPIVPERTKGPVLVQRSLSAAWGGALLARGRNGSIPLAAVAAALAAPVGAVAGVRWRAWWSEDHPAWVGGIIEDAVALALARFAAADHPDVLG